MPALRLETSQDRKSEADVPLQPAAHPVPRSPAVPAGFRAANNPTSSGSFGVVAEIFSRKGVDSARKVVQLRFAEKMKLNF